MPPDPQSAPREHALSCARVAVAPGTAAGSRIDYGLSAIAAAIVYAGDGIRALAGTFGAETATAEQTEAAPGPERMPAEQTAHRPRVGWELTAYSRTTSRDATLDGEARCRSVATVNDDGEPITLRCTLPAGAHADSRGDTRHLAYVGEEASEIRWHDHPLQPPPPGTVA